MKTSEPSYSAKFECLAEKCPESCCIEWDVDIDKKTADYYRSVQGAFGDKLRDWMRKENELSLSEEVLQDSELSAISDPSDLEEDEPSFRMTGCVRSGSGLVMKIRPIPAGSTPSILRSTRPFLKHPLQSPARQLRAWFLRRRSLVLILPLLKMREGTLSFGSFAGREMRYLLLLMKQRI